MAKGRGISLSGSGAVKAFDHGGISCRVCERDLGEKRKAHRIMPKDGGRCEEHYRFEAGEPQRTQEAKDFIERWKRVVQQRDAAAQSFPVSPQPGSDSLDTGSVLDEEDSSVPKRKPVDAAMIAEMRKDAEAGMSINQISVKHAISWPTVKLHLGGVRNGHGKSGHAKKNGRTAIAQGNGSTGVQVGVELLDRVWATLAPE